MIARCLLLGIVLVLISSSSRAAEKIDFNRDIRPILNNHCLACHGFDEKTRKGGLRLDRRDAAIAVREGTAAIVPGKPEQSQLMARIVAHDDEQMPPKSFKKPLSDRQIEQLKQWIAEGARYSDHWAFQTPRRPEIPQTSLAGWTRNPIDAFVLKTLEAERLKPAPEATKGQWLRRVTLDLTGLPPTPEEYRAFEADRRPEAYEAVVDRLLKTTRYAERMALPWLDLARYADTNGYNNDELRTMWPWRDWVIRSFAEGMTYDRFLTEQLAGDLLPDATISQKVATGFNRNHVLTTEGGIIEEEYRVEYVADRVHTAATAILGMSMNCARCHDHKYDPISQKEYYQFSAFFANIPDKVVGYGAGVRMAEPVIRVPSAEQQAALEQLKRRRGELEQLIAARTKNLDAEQAAWEASLKPDEIARISRIDQLANFPLDDAKEYARNTVDAERKARFQGSLTSVDGQFGKALRFDGKSYLEAGPVGDSDTRQPLTLSAWVKPDTLALAAILSRMDDGNGHRGYDILIESGKISTHFVHRWPDDGFKVLTKTKIPEKQWTHVAVVYDGSANGKGIRIFFNGKPQDVEITNDKTLKGTIRTDKPFHIGRRGQSLPFQGAIQHVQVFATALNEHEVQGLHAGQPIGNLKELLALPAEKRTATQKKMLQQYYATRIDKSLRDWQRERDEIPGRITKLEETIPATMVMGEMSPPRKSYVLTRGEYDKRGEAVTHGVPAVFPKLPEGAPANRLTLAKWLTSPEHPLTARVAVNRWWEMFFGMGLVETSEDFGIQGVYPSHPELLDFLATELIRTGWDTRAILKMITLSATYRQSSTLSAELRERDPRNRLLARGPRGRLTAETLRDQALFVSGLLVEKVGGPSVRPYQPAGLWEEVSVERRDSYKPDEGEGLYRRTMYTFWKRTCPPPAANLFDAPDREFCTVRRATTNTPLHALVVLNDPTYVEAARKLAERIMKQAESDADRLAYAGQLLLGRTWTESEADKLRQSLKEFREHYSKLPKEAEALMKVGKSPYDRTLPLDQLAAWSAVSSLLLNLSEVITKP